MPMEPITDVRDREQPGAVASTERPSVVAIIWHAIRPHTLTIAMSPVFVGVSLALLETGGWRVGPFIATLLGAVLIQIGTNLYNDACDYLKGGDVIGRLGPTRVTAAGWLTPSQVQGGAMLAFALAAWVGLYLIWLGGWPILVIGIASIIAGIAYSAGPKPIEFTAMGEVFVFVFFGPVAVLGTYYLQTGELSLPAVFVASMVGLHAAAVLTVNNHRDREADRAVGRVTLAHRLGVSGTRWLYAALVLGPFVLLLPLAAEERLFWLPALMLPLALLLCRQIVALEPGQALNAILVGTARLQFAFALSLTIAALIAARLAPGELG